MIYLDSAATTFQKPAAVQRAVVRAMRTMSSPGRGGYAAAQQADELLFRCRSAAAELFSVPSSEQVVFTMNATHGLNIAIKSLVRPCGRVVVSGYEHNAVTRPLHALGAEVIVAAAPLFSPQETVEAFERALAHEPDAVICTHVSNVFGAILPIERIAQLCRGASVPLIIDASQSAGSLPIDFSALAPAFLAMPGHKGLYGPQGTGLLLCGSDALPLIEGGTGSESLRQSMPDFLPDRLEAGTHNVPGIAGLEAGIAFVRAQRPERILHHSRALIRRAGEGLGKIPNVHGFLSLEASLQAGVLSFTVDGLSPESVAEEMAKRGIALRAGLHCAPFAHKTVGTLPDGTVRLSVSAFNRESEDRHVSFLSARDRGRSGKKLRFHRKFIALPLQFGVFHIRISNNYCLRGACLWNLSCPFWRARGAMCSRSGSRTILISR